MPAPRLPWFKVWAEAVDHEKIAQLSDPLFRTWITTLARASQQPTRWRFASLKHAAIATGRPVAQVKALVTARLLDVAEGNPEVWVHDWKQWQERYPSDLDRSPNGDGLLPEDSANGALNTPPTLREDSVDDSAKPLYKKRELRVKTGDVDVEDSPFVNEYIDAAAVAASPGPVARERRDDDVNGGGGFRSLGSLLNNDGGRRRPQRPRLDSSDLPDEVRERLQRPPIGSPS